MSKSLAPLLRHGARRGLPTRAGFSRGQAPSRRDVLRFGSAGLAAAVLAPALAPLGGCAGDNHGAQSSGPGINKQRTVIVIGAGFAGLACADTLAHARANVILLEATGRAGGRVRSDRLFIPGDAVELGGEWIGTNHPTWLAYAQEFSLRLEEPNAPPQPESTGVAPTEPGAAAPGAPPGATQPANGNGATSVPRPVPFETEMDTQPGPAGGGGSNGGPTGAPQVSARTRVLAAAMFQQPADVPAQQPGTQPAPGAAEKPIGTPATPPAPGAPKHAKEGDEPIILGGKLIRGAEADKLYEEVDAVLAKVIELARGIDPIRPWRSPNAAELDARSFAAFIADQQGLSDAARALILTGAESDNGVPADRMSLLAYAAMVAGGGFQDYYELSETYRLADGNDALATALWQKLGNRIHFNSYVDAIRRTPYGVIVRTRAGDYYRGDAVVIATPPSTWNQFHLEPPLNEALRPQMGENVKLVLALREPVWEKDGLTSQATSDGLIGLTWAATDPHRRAGVALTLFSGANQAEALRQLVPVERQTRATASLEPAYPGLADATTKSLFIDWPGFTLTRASYSFPAPGQVTAFGPVLVDGIVQPGLPPLMFAGEHTSYAFIGYMEGALSSGVRAAQQVLAAFALAAKTAAETQPAETQPAGTQPALTQPVPTQPAETQPAPQTVPATEPAGQPA